MSFFKKGTICLLTLASAFTFAACGKKKNKTTEKPTTTEGPINPDDYLTPDVAGNLIKNGNFNTMDEVETASSGDQVMYANNNTGGEYWLYGIGGAGEMKITNKHELEIGVLKEDKHEYCIQFAYDGFKIYKQNKYTFEFDAYATYDRHMEVRIQMNGSPYTNYMLAGGVSEADTIVKLGTTKQHYKFEFTSQVQDLAPRMVLNCGWFEGDKFIEKYNITFDDDMQPHYSASEFVYIDNIVLKCDYDAGIREDPLNRPMITLNQVGFLPQQVKQVVFRKADGKELDSTYKIVNVDTNQEYGPFNVTALTEKNESSNETVGYGDFSSFTTPGTYKIVGNISGDSYEFTIGTNVYDDLLNDTLMMLYRQRCGEVLGEDENDKFAHDACHQRLATVYGTTTKIDVNGGWHDAGDYGKYVVPGAQTVADLLLTFSKYEDIVHYDSWVTGTDSAIPDLLEEAMWELDWMLKMQKDNGQVYHKVTTLKFPESAVSALDDTEALYVCPPSYAATADFAAVMAKAAVIIRPYDSAKAALYSEAATKAYTALSSMEKKSFVNPDDLTYGQVKTGEYPDSELDDELSWASIEMYNLTGDVDYLNAFLANYTKTTELGLGWANVNGFAVEAYINHFYGNTTDTNLSTTDYEAVLKTLRDAVDELVLNTTKDVYNITIGKTLVDGKEIYQFEWGSNLTIAGNAMLIDFASWYVEDDGKILTYYQTVQKQVNYLLGQNANCYCFVTGYGTLSPENPHHRPSIIAGSGNPMPGMLVGGPDSNFAENGGDNIAKNNCEDNAPALCYIDHNNSWSTNEVTIYWNSPLTYILASVVSPF